MSKPSLYTLANPFVLNRRPISENEAIRVARWLDKKLKKLKVNNYSVGYAGNKDTGYHVEVTDRNIIDAITPNPMEGALPKNR